jgi:preprotein translocase subunit YajC
VSNAAPLLLLLGVAVVFWLLMLRPAQRQRRELHVMQSSVAVGDEVMTTSGIFGRVRALDEETVRLEISDGVEIRVVRAAIGRVVEQATPSRDEQTGLAAAPAEPEEKLE